ncbi:flagellar basal body-associated protein FliL [Psychrobium sp. 1_MG-2023]|uniref:flagellar basal body-associated protein FliL n=1 Tax=Psychrobium sp. 1_MG-2023 TaxID=3062624 RepID=UPI000C3213A1|nr:flagellar basal body-associated protein FliL [Psychrobium sp. 1_MG-2023]MDP2559563.1 flagellar basal body-associated protein FliL [Psychrobium sp. 1_MG-2023]PKF59402.1 flagellar basal body-associated protein FliL [Alteromonadales bacterium alter-6D02]
MRKLTNMLVLIMLLGCGLSSSFHAQAEDGAPKDYAYFGFEPDIITNYISKQSKKIGYVRITMEIMVASPDHIAIIEHHAPLLRAAVVEVLGEQDELKVKSPTGKSEIRELCFETINRLLKEETGQELAVSLLFTKYIYH